MSAPETADGAARDGWGDDSPIRCVSCGGYYSPDDGDFVITVGGPLCRHCSEPSEATG
jgi:hypothetical protein